MNTHNICFCGELRKIVFFYTPPYLELWFLERHETLSLIFQATRSGENTGVLLDDFNILRVIGRGSYAKVLMVEQKRTKRLYAMKVIKKELVNDDEVGLFLPAS